MNELLDCVDVELLAPELALGSLAGPDRAAALAHLAGCPTCQSLVEEFSTLADRLLLLAPEDEPSPGFESRVLVAANTVPPAARASRRWSRPWRLAAAAAAVALVVSAGVLVGRRGGHQARLTADYVNALQRLGGRALRAAPLVDGAGRRVGQAFIYDGAPSWVFVSIDGGGTDGGYSVVCTGPSGRALVWPGLQVSAGRGALGISTGADLGGVDHVRVVDQRGATPYRATIDASHA